MIQMNKREQVGAIVLVGLLLIGLIMRFALSPKPVELEVIPPQVPTEKEKEPDIVVHVAGAVRIPGVYTLPAGARVINALEAAGGVLTTADQHALNLAEPLYDGRRITVPYLGEQKEDSGESDGKVNINTASAAEFDQLPGIGPTKAAAIVAYREKNGPFKTLEDLAKVTGIGPNTVETLREYLTLY